MDSLRERLKTSISSESDTRRCFPRHEGHLFGSGSSTSESSKRWRKAILVLNATRRFRRFPLQRRARTRFRVCAHIICAVGRLQSGLNKRVKPAGVTPDGYGVAPSDLVQLLQDREYGDLEKLGGVEGLARELHTDLKYGLDGYGVAPSDLVQLLQDREYGDLEKLGGVEGLARELHTDLKYGLDGYGVAPSDLVQLLQDREYGDLEKLGGVEGLARELHTDLEYGLDETEEQLHKRREAYGSNTYPKKDTILETSSHPSKTMEAMASTSTQSSPMLGDSKIENVEKFEFDVENVPPPYTLSKERIVYEEIDHQLDVDVNTAEQQIQCHLQDTYKQELSALPAPRRQIAPEVEYSKVVIQRSFTDEQEISLSPASERQVGPEISEVHTPNHITESGLILDSLPDDLLRKILKVIPYESWFRMKLVSKSTKQVIESVTFKSLIEEALANVNLTAVHFTRNERGVWQGQVFDLTSGVWWKIPTFSILPQVIDSTSQEYLIAGGGGILCFLDVSSSNVVTVGNPWAQETKALPALTLGCRPKLMHVTSDPKTVSSQVIVAGYSSTEGVLSIHAMIYDYTTSTWTATTSDISRIDLRFKQYQTGAVADQRLYCIAEDRRRNQFVLQCNLATRTWLNQIIPLPRYQQDALPSCSTVEAQLVTCNGNVICLLSRQGITSGFTPKVQSLHMLVQFSTADPQWEQLWRRPEEAGRYPEYTCAPCGDDKLCIYDTKDVTGFVYDIHANSFCELPPRCKQVSGITYGIKNHLGFMLQPNFKQKP